MVWKVFPQRMVVLHIAMLVGRDPSSVSSQPGYTQQTKLFELYTRSFNRPNVRILNLTAVNQHKINKTSDVCPVLMGAGDGTSSSRYDLFRPPARTTLRWSARVGRNVPTLVVGRGINQQLGRSHSRLGPNFILDYPAVVGVTNQPTMQQDSWLNLPWNTAANEGGSEVVIITDSWWWSGSTDQQSPKGSFQIKRINWINLR